MVPLSRGCVPGAACPNTPTHYTPSLPQVVCYYTNWSQYRQKLGKFMPEHIDPFLCSHIIYAFGWMKKGRLSSFEANDESKDGKTGFYEQINGLKKQNPKLKVLLALGEWRGGTGGGGSSGSKSLQGHASQGR